MMSCGMCGSPIVTLRAKFDFQNAAYVWNITCNRGHTIVPLKDDELTFDFSTIVFDEA